MASDLLRIENFLCFAIYSANLAFNRVYRPLLDKLGLTYVQYIVLVVLWERDDQFVGELGDKIFLASSTLTPVIKRLESMGYLLRSRDTVDERQVRIRLTRQGRLLKARACELPECILTAAGMHPKNMKALQDGIVALRDRLLAGPPSGLARPDRPRTSRKSDTRAESPTLRKPEITPRLRKTKSASLLKPRRTT